MDKQYLEKLKNINNDKVYSYLKSEFVFEKYSYTNAVAIAYVLYKIKCDSKFKNLDNLLDNLSNKTKLRKIIESRIPKYWNIIEKTINEFCIDELLSFILFGSNYVDLDVSDATPDSLSKLAIKILNIEETDKFLELCSGSGAFMVESIMNSKVSEYTGIELNYDANDIATIRAEIIEKNISFILFDALDYKNEYKYNKIFANYPFGIRNIIMNYNKENIAKSLNIPNEFLKNCSSDWVFNTKIIEQLKNNGKAVAIMSNGSAWNSTDKKIRKFFIDNKYIEAIISLPEKLFNNTSIGTTLIVFSNNNENIRFIDASKECKMQKRNNIFTDDNIDKIIQSLSVDSDISITKSIEDLSKNDYILSATSYTEKVPEIKNGIEFGTIVKNITRGAQLKSTDLDKIKTQKETLFQLINISKINNGLLLIDEDCQFLTEIPENLEKYCIKNNSLVISKIGTPFFKSAVVSVKENEKLLANGNLFIIELDDNKINPFYLQAFLVSNLGKSILNKIKTGSQIPTLSIDKLLKIDIPLPNLEIQERIGNKYAATMDEIILLRKRLEKVENKINYVFDEEGGNC